MKDTIKILLMAAVFFNTTLFLSAEEADTNIDAGIIVKDKRIKRDPTSNDIIEVGENSKAMDSISDTLSDRVGVQIKRYGGLGSYSTISIRGASSNQVMIYLDGVPLSDSIFGDVNLENFPIDNLETIEIYRGFSPIKFGIPGMGGVVNLVTKKSKNEDENYIQAAYGSYNSSKLVLSRSQRFEHLNYFLCFNRTSSTGDFKFKDDNGTPVINTTDDHWEKRKNNKNESYGLTSKAGYRIDEVEFNILNDFFYKKQGIPGMNTNDSEYANYGITRNITNINAKMPKLLIQSLNTEINLFYALKRDLFDDSHGEIGFTAQKQLGYFDTFGGSLLNELNISKINQILNLIISGQRETYHNKQYLESQIADSRGPTQIRDRANIGIEDNWMLFGDRLQIVPQFRFNVWRDRLTLEKDSFTVREDKKEDITNKQLDWLLGSHLYLYKHNIYIKGVIGTSYRAPSFIELFGERGVVKGNPNLTPEKSINRDISVGLNFEYITDIIDEINIEYVYFNNSIDNIIQFIQNSQHTMRAENISAASISGHEISISISLFQHFTWNTNYTYQRAVDKSNIPHYRNNRLPYLPMHEIATSVKLYNDYGSISYEMNYTGSNYRDRANSEFNYIDQRIYHNIIIKGIIISGLIATFEIKNLTDNRTQDIVGYPLPGRSYYGSLSYSF